MSKNYEIQFFDSQVYLPVILTPWLWKFFSTMVEYTGLGKNQKVSLEAHRIMIGCIFEANCEGLG